MLSYSLIISTWKCNKISNIKIAKHSWGVHLPSTYSPTCSSQNLSHFSKPFTLHPFQSLEAMSDFFLLLLTAHIQSANCSKQIQNTITDWLQPCLTQWTYEPCHVGPPKTDRSWWRVLTKRGPLEKGMGNHFSILALKTPSSVLKLVSTGLLGLWGAA